MAYAKNKKRVGFALSPEEMELLQRNMDFYHCKSYGQYFRLKLRTDNILFESLKKEKKDGR